jgi:hypothetical protein
MVSRQLWGFHECAHNPPHCSHTFGAETKNLPYLIGGGDRIADNVGAHCSIVGRGRVVGGSPRIHAGGGALQRSGKELNFDHAL